MTILSDFNNITKKIMDYKNLIIRGFSSLILLTFTLSVVIFFDKKICFLL